MSQSNFEKLVRMQKIQYLEKIMQIYLNDLMRVTGAKERAFFYKKITEYGIQYKALTGKPYHISNGEHYHFDKESQ